MQSSMAVAGMDALSYPCENILTRRANQWHYSIIAQFAKRPWPCPTTGSSSAIAGKKSLPTIEVAPARRSCMGSPKLHRLATAKGRLSRCRTVPDLDKATALVPGSTNRYCSPSFETATEPVIGRGDISAAVGWAKRSVPTIQDRDHISGGHGARGAFAHPTIRSHALRMRSNSLKHNNLMLRSERRERLEAWAVSDSQI